MHPTKIEVRFRDSHRVYSHLLSTLRQTFLKSDLHSRLQSAQEPPQRRNRRRSAWAPARWLRPEQGPGADTGFRQGGSIGRFDLAGDPTRPADGGLLVRAGRSKACDTRIGGSARSAAVGSVTSAGISRRCRARHLTNSRLAAGPSHGCRPATGRVSMPLRIRKTVPGRSSPRAPAEEQFHESTILFVRAYRSRRAVHRSNGCPVRAASSRAGSSVCSRPFRFMIVI